MLFRILIIVLILCYPIVVFVGLTTLSLTNVSLLLLSIVILRIIVNGKKTSAGLLIATSLGAFAIGLGIYFNNELGVKIYPVVINTSLAVVFAWSLYRGPTVIEKIAGLKTPNLPEHVIQYTRKVTKVWLAFFIINGCISGYTALFTDIEIWTLYNGIISYLLMGIIFAVEYLVRLRVQKAHGS